MWRLSIEQVKLLNEIRSGDPQEENRGTKQLRSMDYSWQKVAVDRVLEGCFQLLSLFFMTIGRNNEAPAAYALTSTIRRLLDHLTEANLYSAKDLEHIHHTLESLGTIVENARQRYPKLTTLLSHRLAVCNELCSALLNKLDRMDPNLAEMHQKLISILRCISLANTKTKASHFYSTPTRNFVDTGLFMPRFSAFYLFAGWNG
jgi:hypothetical protein